jgi:hypothetical protein
MIKGMSETMLQIERDAAERDRGGRFVIGGKPGPGRPVGSRSRLGEQFLLDLRDAWSEHGPTALARCAEEEPAQFCRIVASLLPKDVNVNTTVGVDAHGVLATFRAAVEALGNTPPARLPNAKVIDAGS